MEQKVPRRNMVGVRTRKVTHMFTIYFFNNLKWVKKQHEVHCNHVQTTESFLRNQQTFSYSRNSPHFLEPRGFLLNLKKATTFPCPEPDQSIPSLPSHLLKIHFTTTPPTRLGIPSPLYSSGLPTKTLYAYLLFTAHATCSVHLVRFYLIIWIIFGEEHKS
jgi:hypothetical protein